MMAKQGFLDKILSTFKWYMKAALGVAFIGIGAASATVGLGIPLMAIGAGLLFDALKVDPAFLKM